MSNEITILDVFTMDELEILEQATGKDINDIFGKGGVSGRTMKLMVWLLMKRKDANVDIAEAGKLTFAECSQFIQGYLSDPKAQ